MMVEFHADDFGLFEGQSRRILACHTDGALNGISIIVNGDCLGSCLNLIRPVADQLAVSVHLNFLQGRSLCSREEVDLLTDEDGVFNISFAKLLTVSFLPARGKYLLQLKKEIRAQIFALLPFLQETGKPIRIDGHAHWHMIPVVFDALMEVIDEEKLEVSYIRIPAEPVSVMLRYFFHLIPFNPINIVKMLLLNWMAGRNGKKYRRQMCIMNHCVFTGVLLSGRFSFEKASALLPALQEYARKKGCGIELLAHPGSVREEADLLKVTNRQDVAFFASPDRAVEAEMFRQIAAADMTL